MSFDTTQNYPMQTSGSIAPLYTVPTSLTAPTLYTFISTNPLLSMNTTDMSKMFVLSAFADMGYSQQIDSPTNVMSSYPVLLPESEPSSYMFVSTTTTMYDDIECSDDGYDAVTATPTDSIYGDDFDLYNPPPLPKPTPSMDMSTLDASITPPPSTTQVC